MHDNIIRVWSRRKFFKIASMSAAATVFGMGLGGCAKNPVTGRSQFMLVSREEEIALDKQASPHQLSNDYGPVQDPQLQKYVNSVGKSLAATSHRPDMPYSFDVVNANYVNAYAFPGGTIAITRGIMIELDNEAEMAALLGHEIGHVNARHTASRMSSKVATGFILGGASAIVGAKYGGGWGALAGGVGGFAAGALLASYSRDDERQADSLGMEYMVKSGYNPDGMVGLMDMLNDQHDREPSALEVMFSTHPMSSERLVNTRKEIVSKYMSASEYKIYRERFMDNTASLRKIKPAIQEMQKAEKLMGQKKFGEAEDHLHTALKQAPDDYVGLLLMSKCLISQNKIDESEGYAARAKDVNPNQPQARQINAMLQLNSGNFAGAYENFSAYDKQLPGNPYAAFYKGYSLEGMGERHEAAREYVKFLRDVKKGKEAQHAYNRLVQWGYIKGEAGPPVDVLA